MIINNEKLFKQLLSFGKPFVVASRGRNPINPHCRDSGLETLQMIEPKCDEEYIQISNTITTVQKDNYVCIPGVSK